jgi:hypothetical protein
MRIDTQRISPFTRTCALAAVAVCAFALRAAHVAAILHSPVGDSLVQDARAYHAEAVRLVAAAPSSPAGPSFINLGYPYALAAVYAMAGAHAASMLFVQAALGALSCVLLALTARQLFESDWAAIVTGVLYALYRPAVFYDGLLLTPSLTSFAVIASLAAAVAGSKAIRFRYVLLIVAGGCNGFAAILRPNLVLLVPALAVAAACLTPAASRRRGAIALILGAIAVLAPVAVAQRVAHGAWVPLSANGGMNFWTGNHLGARGAYQPADFVDEQNAQGEESGFLDEARRRSGRATMTLAESSGFWFDQAVGDIRPDPVRWLGLLGEKLLLSGSRLELRTNVSIGFHERLSPALRRTPVGFPLLFAAGLAGLAALVAAGRRSEAMVVASTVLVAAATCTLFFAASEYRHIAASGLALGAGAVVALPRAGARWAALFAGSLALAWSLAFAPADLAAASDPAIDFSNFAHAICVDGLKAGDAATAIRRADALLDLAPNDLAKPLYVADARFWVRTIATRDGSRETLIRAFDAGESLLDALPKIEEPVYSREFRLRVRKTLTDRLQLLASSPGLAEDPVLRERAQGLLARSRLGPSEPETPR